MKTKAERRSAPLVSVMYVRRCASPVIGTVGREEHGIEIMAAFGVLNGKVWRIGLMGYNARLENAIKVLAALESVLHSRGFDTLPRAGVQAARAYVQQADATATG